MQNFDKFSAISDDEDLNKVLLTIGMDEQSWKGLMQLLINVCGENKNQVIKLFILTALRNPKIDRTLLHPLNTRQAQQRGIDFPSDLEIDTAEYLYQHWLKKLQQYESSEANQKKIEGKYPFLQQEGYAFFHKIIEEVAGMIIADKLELLKRSGKIDSYGVYTTTPIDDIRCGADLVAMIQRGRHTSVTAIDIAISGNIHNIHTKQEKRTHTNLVDFNEQVLQIPSHVTIPRRVINITPEQMQKYLDYILTKLFREYSQNNNRAIEYVRDINLFNAFTRTTQQVLQETHQDVASLIRAPHNIISVDGQIHNFSYHPDHANKPRKYAR